MAIGDKASDGYKRVGEYIDEALSSESLDHDEAIVLLITLAAQSWMFKQADAGHLNTTGSMVDIDHRMMALNDRRTIDLIKIIAECGEMERKRLIERSGEPY